MKRLKDSKFGDLAIATAQLWLIVNFGKLDGINRHSSDELYMRKSNPDRIAIAKVFVSEDTEGFRFDPGLLKTLDDNNFCLIVYPNRSEIIIFKKAWLRQYLNENGFEKDGEGYIVSETLELESDVTGERGLKYYRGKL